MPFIAIDENTRTRIDITNFSRPTEELYGSQLICQNCGGRLSIVSSHFRGDSAIPSHFRHRAECDGAFETSPETPEHRAAKRYVRNLLKKEYESITDAGVELEMPIEMKWRPKGRIADICVEFPFGLRYVYEIQLSSITLEEVISRTEDYERAGCIVYWIFSSESIKQNIEDWCYYHQEDVYIISFTENKRYTSSSKK